MSIRFERVGTGLTERIEPIIEIEEVALEPASNDRPERFVLKIKRPLDAGQAHAVRRTIEQALASSTFDGLTAPWEAVAREILARAGLPLVDRKVRVDPNGGWTDDLPDDWLQRPLEILRPGEWPADAIDLAESRYGIDS
jgi:hypothetical protein